MEDDCQENFRGLQRRLTDAGVPFQVRPEVVRGLDYYTETVFEFLPGEGQSSLCGGGRYDNLVRDLGGAPIPSVGVGIGVERTLLAMAEEGVEISEAPMDAFVVQGSAAAYEPSLALARSLRGAGLSVLTDIDGRSMKSQLRQADKSGARYALILGEEELTKGSVQAKDLKLGTQVELPTVDVAAYLQGRP